MNTYTNNSKAIILIFLGMTVFSLQDAFIKLLSDSINLYLIYFVRCIIGLLVIICYLKIKNIPIVFKTYYLKLTVLRTVAFFIGFSLYYFSLSKLSLALAVTLFFVSPFFVSIFSMIIIKEKVGLRRWGAIIIGFIGVYLVMNPNFEAFNIYTLFPVLCAICYAFTVVIQKKTSDKDTVFSQILHIYLSALFFSLIIKLVLLNITFNPETLENYNYILRNWEIDSFFHLSLLLSIGFTGVIGFLCLFTAYNIGSPSAIAPFEYIIIFYAIIISWIIWDETLNLRAFIGLVLIITAGIYTFFREAKLSKSLSINKPLR